LCIKLVTETMLYYDARSEKHRNMSITPIHTVNNNGLRIIATILCAEVEICIERNYFIRTYIYFLVFISLMKQYEPKHIEPIVT
jgi:hypothetical protein